GDPRAWAGSSGALRGAEGGVRAVRAGTECDLRRFQDERDVLALPVLEATDAIAAFDWTLEELPERHKRFSETMKAEAAQTARWSSNPAADIRQPAMPDLSAA